MSKAETLPLQYPLLWPVVFQTVNSRQKLPLPQVATIGFAFTPNDKLAIALDVAILLDGKPTIRSHSIMQIIQMLCRIQNRHENIKNTMAFRLGLQYKINEKFSARIGVAYGLSPVQNGYVTPETPDADRINFTAGVGYMIMKILV